MQKHLIILSILVTPLLLFGQTENIHNTYKSTFAELSDITAFYSNSPVTDAKSEVNMFASTNGYLLLIESGVKTRRIKKEKLKWLGSIFASLKIGYQPKDLFTHEVLVKGADKEYWFPIQKNLIEYWMNEMKEGQKALINIRVFGSLNIEEEEKWLFTINSFNAGFYDGLWEEAMTSFGSGNSPNALRCLNKMIELNPKDGRNHAMYGFYYYQQGYPDNVSLLQKADSLYDIGLKYSPDYGYGYYQRALTQIQLREYMAAWDDIEKARSLKVKGIESFIIERLENKLSYSDYLVKKKR